MAPFVSTKPPVAAGGLKRYPNACQKPPKKSSWGVPKWENRRPNPLLDFRWFFKSFFFAIFGIPKGAPGHPKMSQKRVKSQTRLRGASGASFWSHFGVILEPPGVHCRASGGRFSSVRGHLSNPSLELFFLFVLRSSSFSALLPLRSPSLVLEFWDFQSDDFRCIFWRILAASACRDPCSNR